MYMALPAVQHLSRLGHLEILEVDEEDLNTENLHAHVVAEDTKRLLLTETDRHPLTPAPSPSSVSPSLDAETLLQDLGQLAPSVAKTLTLKQQAQDNLVFSLINDVDFDEEERSFIALSYCWKKISRETPRKEVSHVGELPFGWVREVEQFPLPTSRAMFEAVLRERRDEMEGLWFDQVCINQEDEAEKSAAIGAIDSIYKNARTVVVALDDIAAEEDEVAFLRQYIEHYSNSELPMNQQPNRGLNPPFMQQHAPFRTFIERTLGSIWFERAWCAHEMRMGRSHIFLVPCVTDENEEPYMFIRFTGAFFLHLLILASELTHLPPGTRSRMRSLQEYFSRTVLREQYSEILALKPSVKLPQLQLPNLQPPSFLSLVSEIFSMKAGGNPRLPEYLRRLDANRDKTSITLNASGFPVALMPSSPLQRPSIEDECLRLLLLISLASQDPVALCTTGSPLQLHDGSVSWLRRPTSSDVPSRSQHTPLPRVSRDAVAAITQASDGRAEFVQLDLVFPELPHRTQPNPNFTNRVQRARVFIDLAIQCRIQSSEFWSSWQTQVNHPRAPAMRNIFVQTLACCFECGPQWVLDVSSNLPQSHGPNRGAANSLSPEAVEVIFNPNLIIQNYIITADGQQKTSILLDFLSKLITLGIPWGSGASERTHGPLIISPPNAPELSSPPAPSPSTISTSHPHSRSASTTPYTHSRSSSIVSYTHSPLASSPHSQLPSPTAGGKALIFAPFMHSKTLLVAIPDAVKAAEYGSLARGWILTPMNPYTGAATGTGSPGGSSRHMVCWTLQGRSVIFGERAFDVGVAGSAGGAKTGGGAKRHRVYGPSGQ